ncbi:MAG: TlpA disulfide reductase family protein [Bacteroidota bacterium]
MKKHLALLLSLFFVSLIYSQKTIENPKTGFSTASYLSISKIEITDSTTVVSFEISQYQGFNFTIPKKTYIKDVASDEKIFIKSAEGVSMQNGNVIPESGVLNYKLTFGNLDKSATKIEYGEANEGGNWFIYDIALQNLPNPSGINAALEGNWFNTENADWEIGFYDSNVVYKSQVWKYNAVALKNGNGSISLTNKDQKIKLFVKKGKEGTYYIGENPKSPIVYSNTAKNVVPKSTNADVPYKIPVFKNDSTTYSGYIKNYSSKATIKTIAIHVDDIITGAQNTHIAKLDENGFFSIKLPLYYPHEVWVRSSVFNGSVYLEPGKNVFQLLGEKQMFYMGESAKLNVELNKFNPRWFDYNDMMSKIQDMKPGDYKPYCQNLADKEMAKLETLKVSNAIGDKVYQVKKLDIQYGNILNMMEYRSNFENAYRMKNKIPREQRTLDIKIDTLTTAYYDFITDEIVNNPLAVLSNGYKYFINRLEYTDLVYPKSVTVSIFDSADELQKIGYSLTDKEKLLLSNMKEIEALRNSPDQKEFNEKYGKISLAFYTKHQKIIQKLIKDSKFDNKLLVDYLIKNQIPIDADEKEFLAAQNKLEKSASSAQIKKYGTAVNEDFNLFNKKYQELMNSIYAQKRTLARNEKLEQLFGIKTGLATDIISTQGLCNSIVDQLTPIAEKELSLAQQQIKTPFVAQYLGMCNEQTLAKLEANKKLKGYVLNETPKTEGDELFASIMKKYEGKVVYVDFWATWCGPCRSGIEQIKPLKEEMKGENVAFVYLTNQSSPEKTYSAMIPEIKGEHYRLSTDEWNYLAGKFNISGIPHYVLVGKKGEVINPKLGFMSNEAIKTELEKRIKE